MPAITHFEWPNGSPPLGYHGGDGAARILDFRIVDHEGEGTTAGQDRIVCGDTSAAYGFPATPASTLTFADMTQVLNYSGDNVKEENPYVKIGAYLDPNTTALPRIAYHQVLRITTGGTGTEARDLALAALNRQMDRCIRFQVKAGDYPNNSVRAEMAGWTPSSVLLTRGVTYWLAWDMFLPTGTNRDRWSVYFQVHGGSGSPILSCNVQNSGALKMIVRNTSSGNAEAGSGTVESSASLGVWHRFLAQCNFSHSGGFSRVWHAKSSPATGGTGGGTTVPAKKTGTTFGQTSAGTAYTNASANGKRGTVISSASTGTLQVQRIEFYLRGTGSGATPQPARAVIYTTDANGNPLSLLHTSQEVTFTGDEAPAWEVFLPNGALNLTVPGRWLVGLHTGDGDAIAYAHFTVTGALRFGAGGSDLYSDGAEATWSATGVDDKEMSVAVIGTLATGTGNQVAMRITSGFDVRAGLTTAPTSGVVPTSEIVTVNVPVILETLERRNYRRNPSTKEPDLNQEYQYDKNLGGWVPKS